MTANRVPILWLVGPSGVGKTTLARELYARLGRRGITAAHIDTDMIGLCFPAPEADPYQHRLKARNLGALWPVFQDAGAQCLVLAGSIEEPEHVALYAGQVPGSVITVCQIRLGGADHRARILERNGKSVAWADDLIAEGEAMGRAGFADVVAETGGLSVPDAAERVLAACGGWPVIA